jgi:hypothetical protein
MEVKMSKQTLRYAIFILGLITGVIHTVILYLLGYTWLLMPLNGLGFIILTGLVFFRARYASWTAQIDNLSIHGLYTYYDCGLFCDEFCSL